MCTSKINIYSYMLLNYQRIHFHLLWLLQNNMEHKFFFGIQSQNVKLNLVLILKHIMRTIITLLSQVNRVKILNNIVGLPYSNNVSDNTDNVNTTKVLPIWITSSKLRTSFRKLARITIFLLSYPSSSVN